MPHARKNDIGTVIAFTFSEDITNATDQYVRVQKQSGAVVAWETLEIVDANTMEYTVQAGDLDEVGTYQLQPFYTLGDWSGGKNIVNLHVGEVLADGRA